MEHTQHAASSAASAQPAAYPVVYRNLMVVGLLGSIYRKHEDAELVSSAVEATLSDKTQYRMYCAIARGIGGDAKFAADVLGEHLEQFPDDDAAKVTLAVAMMLAGDPEWKSVIDRVLALSTDQTAREAAVGVISYLTTLTRH